MDTKGVGPWRTVTISILCLILSCILHYDLPKSALSCEFWYLYFGWIIYSATASELYLRLYWYVCAFYNGVCIEIFVHLIMVSVLLCLCMLYIIIVGYTSSWYFVLYLSCGWVIAPLSHCYIYVCITMFVHVIYMVNVICLCT